MDYTDLLNQYAGVSDTKRESATQAAQDKKARLSGDPNFYNIAAAQQSPNLVQGLAPEEQDAAQLDYFDFANKYGYERADQLLSGKLSGVRDFTSDSEARRSNLDAVTDSAVGVGQGVANFVGGTAALAGGMIHPSLGGGITQGLDWLNQKAEGFKSNSLAARQRTVAARKQLRQNINDAQYQSDIENGAGIEADLARMGRGFIDGMVETISDPQTAGDLISQGVGSVIPVGTSARLAQAGINALRGTAVKPGAWAGASVIGASTAGGAYQQTYTEALQRLSDRSDLSQEEKESIANKAALTAAAVVAPAAVAAGRLVAPFEMSPLAKGNVSGLISKMGGEFLEEGVQSGSEKFGQNIGIKAHVDPTQSISEGVGEQMGEGAIAGLGTAGVIGVPGTVTGTVSNLGRSRVKRKREDKLKSGEEAVNNIQQNIQVARDIVSADETPISQKEELGKVVETSEKLQERIQPTVEEDTEPSKLKSIWSSEGTIQSKVEQTVAVLSASENVLHDPDALEAYNHLVGIEQDLNKHFSALESLESLSEEQKDQVRALNEISDHLAQTLETSGVVSKIQEIHQDLVQKAKNKELSADEVNQVADMFFESPASFIESGLDIEDLIDGMDALPESQEKTQKVDALRRADEQVKALILRAKEHAALSETQGKVRTNVALESRKSFTALNDHLADIIRADALGSELKETVHSLGLFAQSQINKLASLNFSRDSEGTPGEKGPVQPTVMPLTYSREMSQFQTTYGKALFSGRGKVSKLNHEQLKLEAEAAKSIYEAYREKVGLPELNDAGGIWENGKVVPTHFKKNADGNYTQVKGEGTKTPEPSKPTSFKDRLETVAQQISGLAKDAPFTREIKDGVKNLLINISKEDAQLMKDRLSKIGTIPSAILNPLNKAIGSVEPTTFTEKVADIVNKVKQHIKDKPGKGIGTELGNTFRSLISSASVEEAKEMLATLKKEGVTLKSVNTALEAKINSPTKKIKSFKDLYQRFMEGGTFSKLSSDIPDSLKDIARRLQSSIDKKTTHRLLPLGDLDKNEYLSFLLGSVSTERDVIFQDVLKNFLTDKNRNSDGSYTFNLKELFNTVHTKLYESDALTKAQKRVWLVTSKLLPDNSQVSVGANLHGPYAYSKSNTVFLTPRFINGEILPLSLDLLLHETIHVAAQSVMDRQGNKELTLLQDQFKRLVESKQFKSMNIPENIRTRLEYAATKSQEAIAVALGEPEVYEWLDKNAKVRVNALTDLIDIFGGIIDVIKRFLMRQDGSLKDSDLTPVLTLNKIAEGIYLGYAERRGALEAPTVPVEASKPAESTTTSEEAIEPVETVEELAPVEPELSTEESIEPKEVINNIVGSIGFGDPETQRKLAKFLSIGSGNTELLQKLFGTPDGVKNAIQELKKALPAEVGKKVEAQFNKMLEMIQQRAKGFSSKGTTFKNAKERISNIDESLDSIFAQDFATLWLNDKGEFNQQLAELMAITGLSWFYSGQANGSFSDRALATLFSEHFEATVSKEEIPEHIKNKLIKRFYSTDGIQNLARLFSEYSGIRAKTKGVPAAAEGIVSSIGAGIYAALVDARLLARDKMIIAEGNLTLQPMKPLEEIGKVTEGQIHHAVYKAAEDTKEEIKGTYSSVFSEVLHTEEGVKPIYTTEDNKVPVPKTQTRNMVNLSEAQRKVVEIANNTVYRLNNSILDLYKQLGKDGLDYLFGSKLGSEYESTKDNLNVDHKETLEGRRLSVHSAFEDAMNFALMAEGKNENFGFKFAHEISKVHRLQQQGTNTPQGNKVIRALLSPNGTKLNKSEHQDVFDRAMGQALGIKIAEDSGWRDSLQARLDSKGFKEALEAVKALHKGKVSPAQLEALRSELSEGTVTLLALDDYIKWEAATGEVDIHLPIEADGKTNGPAAVLYMLATQFDEAWFDNLNRIGVDIGAKEGLSLETLYNQSGIKLPDIYRNVAAKTQAKVADAVISEAEFEKLKEKLLNNRQNMTEDELSILNKNALFRLMSLNAKNPFYDVAFNEKGELVIGRATVKNPITVTLYGSGTKGIATKLAYAFTDLLVEMASEAIHDPNKRDNLTEIMKNFRTQLSYASAFINPNTGKVTYFAPNSDWNPRGPIATVREFTSLIQALQQHFVDPYLAKAIEEGVSSSAIENTKDLIKFSSIGSGLARIQYQRRVDELHKARDPNFGKADNKKGPEWFLTREDFVTIYKETIGANPMPELEYGDLDYSTRDTAEGSEAFSAISSSSKVTPQRFGGGLSIPRVSDSGVKVLPYSVIASGDAATIFGSALSGVMEKALHVFDGINLTLDAAFDQNEKINAANIKGWSENLYAEFSNMISQIEKFVPDTLNKDDLKTNFKHLYNEFVAKFGEDVVSNPTEFLRLLKLEIETLKETFEHRAVLTDAKLKVIEALGLSSDQFSALEAPHHQKGKLADHVFENGKTFSEMTSTEKADTFNELVAAEMNGVSPSAKGEELSSYLDKVIKDKTVHTEDRRLARAIKALLGNRKLTIRSANKKGHIHGPSSIYFNPGSKSEELRQILSNAIDRVIRVYVNNWVSKSDLNNVDSLSIPMKRMVNLFNTFDTLELKDIVNSDGQIGYRNLISELTTYLGSGANNLADALSEAVARLTDGEPEAATQIANAFTHLLVESLSNSDVRAVLGTKTAMNETPGKVIKQVSAEAKATGSKKLFQFLRSIVKSIFGEQFYKRIFSVKNDVEYTTQLLTAERITNIKTPTPPKKKKTSKEEILAMDPPSFNQGTNSNESSLEALLDSIDPEDIATVNEVLDNKELTLEVQRMLDNLPNILNEHDFILEPEKLEEFKNTLVAVMANTDNNPEIYEELRRIYDKFISNVEQHQLDVTGVGKLRLKFLRGEGIDFKDINKKSVFLPIFASLVQTHPELAQIVDDTVGNIKPDGREESVEQFLKRKNDEFWKKFNKELFDGKLKNLTASKASAYLVQEAGKEQDRTSYIAALLAPVANLQTAIDRNLSRGLERLGEALQGSERSSVKLLGQALDKKAHPIINRAIHILGNQKEVPDMIRATIRDMVSHDSHMEALTTLNKVTKNIFQSLREGIRERMPQQIAELFKTKPTGEQWKMLTDTIGKLDMGIFNGAIGLQYISNRNARIRRIRVLEGILSKQPNWGLAQKKAKQLAKYMNTGIPGSFLLVNAASIATVSAEEGVRRSDGYISDLDQLISLYAFEGLSKDTQQSLEDWVKKDPKALENLLNYVHGVRNQEKELGNSITRLNGKKGYVPQKLEDGSEIRIAPKNQEKYLKERGFTLVAPYRKGTGSQDLYYYHAPVTGLGAFIQGVSQNIRQSSFGVDVITGKPRGSINGGVIDDPRVINTYMENVESYSSEAVEGFIPIFNSDGKVIALERTVDLSKVPQAVFETSYAKLLSIQVGRQYESVGSQEINAQLVKQTFKQWEVEKKDHEKEYINVLNPKELTRVQRDAIALVPDRVKKEAENQFGKGVWMVRRDAMDVAFGYRQPGIGDFFTGVSNWSPETQQKVREAMSSILGTKVMGMVLKGERYWMHTVKEAKNIIVIKSVFVSALNTFFNIIQLMSNDVSPWDIARNTKKYINEANILTDSLKHEIDLNAKLLSETSDDSRSRIHAQISALQESRKRLTIYPLYERGEFGSVQDVGDAQDLKSLGDTDYINKLEEKIEDLPDTLKMVVKNVYMTKDSGTYQFLRKSIEYGDFVAKAILFEDLKKKGGKTDEEIYKIVKSEFVDYDLPAGRNRTWSDSIGLTWFWNYKLRTTKAAFRLFFDHPFKSLIWSMTPYDTPLKENMFAKMLDGSLAHSMGIGQLMRSPQLHPAMLAI